MYYVYVQFSVVFVDFSLFIMKIMKQYFGFLSKDHHKISKIWMLEIENARKEQST